jgi:hypothetical protein
MKAVLELLGGEGKAFNYIWRAQSRGDSRLQVPQIAGMQKDARADRVSIYNL